MEVSMNDVTRLLKQAMQEGWTREEGRKHIKMRHPSGALVVVSRTASDRRAMLNIKADLRRALRNVK
jgi:predicted RNA binding protein YcfA (HicA-like mRNA interferase family)